MSTELIVNASLPETRIALMENGEIQEILIERAQGKGIVGNIYKGRVTRVLPGMQAAFVDIGLEKAAFLYVDDVFVHSEIWAEEEGPADEAEGEGETVVAPKRTISVKPGNRAAAAGGETNGEESVQAEASGGEESDLQASSDLDALDDRDDSEDFSDDEADRIENDAEEALAQHPELLSEEEAEDQMAAHLADDEEDDEEDDDGDPVAMGAEGGDDDEKGNAPKGTISPTSHDAEEDDDETAADFAGEEGDADFTEGSPAGEKEEGDAEAASDAAAAGTGTPEEQAARAERSRRRRRGRRGGRNRRRGRDEPRADGAVISVAGDAPVRERKEKEKAGGDYPEPYQQQVSEEGDVESDRSELSAEAATRGVDTAYETNRPEGTPRAQVRISVNGEAGAAAAGGGRRPEFKETRSRDRKIKSKSSMRPSRMNVNIQDLLKEGQEVIVQIAKDPIATKGARLTCHISLPGRHLVCMPTIDHVGVSRRIERDEERRRLREYVDRNRPKGLGFIVRTATSSGKTKAEARIKQDIDYLSALWNEIKSKANTVSAPALVYEDLNPILRAIRDWVNEDIDKIVVDSRYHYNDVQRFVRNFMPNIMQKTELYQGDVPIFDAYGISTELARALERKVWLKSGGYLVIDQAEALVAIDVNTGRYVGKKSLEDTILKTNLEAVKEIAYQLRLRNCGGIIILDLIDMEKEENKLRVYRALEEELKKDRSRPQILKISELGLVEMTRKRTRDTMVRALCDSCVQCEGKGYIKSKTTVAYEILREIEREGIERDVPKMLIQAHPDVIDVLAIDERESLDQLERRYKKQIYLQAVADHHPEQFEVVNDKNKRNERSEDALLERARELAQTQDRGRRGRGRDRGRGKSGSSSSGGGDRDQPRRTSERGERGGRDRNRDREQPARDPNKPRISIRPGGATVNVGANGGDSPATNAADLDPTTRMDGGEEMNSGAYEGDTGGNGITANGNAPRGDDDFATDEDRLAYLRAQAAQDAALAGGGVAAGAGNRAAPGRGGPAGGGKWGKGGAPAGGRDRNARGGRGRRGRFQRGFRGTEAGAPGAPGATVTPVASSEPAGGNGGGDSGGDDSGGGGDRSNPPV
jgi:ribonuclease G